ncbi:MAG: asparagine synthase (glutamine-hydrolyzing) [Magnetococcales bacterium]|nr:asparagine synthase (glutamine-hydrolyzing) [Magnetococcales bacterium]
MTLPHRGRFSLRRTPPLQPTPTAPDRQLMCGICGFTGPGEGGTLEGMTSTLHHRGPDEAGMWLGEGIALGMRRLAIIDLASGQQPVFNEDRSIVAVFNGEIYNHPELRTTLEARGHRFRSHHADSETIVHLYEEHGLEFIHHLNGMFAIALWDQSRKRLILIRDHAGIKPLYFARVDGELLFGSEPKAILAHPKFQREPDLTALHHYFSFKNIPAPWSAFKGMGQLAPGECLIFAGGEITRERWWRGAFAEDDQIDEERAGATIRDILTDSVRLQMRSDVPFAAYLSGGLDSSSVVALMSRLHDRPIETFTLTYSDELPHKNADRRFARQVSEMYGTHHHEHTITSQDLTDAIPAVIDAFDEPFSGVISTYFVTESIARHVKVALSGDGADELFGSYLPHRLAQPLDYLQRHRQRMGDFDEEDLARLAPFEDQTEWLAAILDRGGEASGRMGQYIADEAMKQDLYTPRMRAAVAGVSTEALVARYLHESHTTDPLNRKLYLDSKTILSDQVLPFVDRLSMAHSVEVRPPFLDPRMIAYAWQLPGGMKIKRGRVKHILKEAVKDLLPADLVDRPKEGFIMPINEWILQKLEGFVRETLSAGALERHGLLLPERVGILIDDHYAGRGNHGNRIWNLMVFQLWWNRFFENHSGFHGLGRGGVS